MHQAPRIAGSNADLVAKQYLPTLQFHGGLKHTIASQSTSPTDFGRALELYNLSPLKAFGDQLLH